MLSRVAESIYWMSRYIERAESVARLIDASLLLSLDMPAHQGNPWAALIATTGDDDVFQKRWGEPTPESVIRFLGFDADHPNSIASCLARARENGRAVRDVISSEMWEQVNRAYLMVRSTSPDRVVDAPDHFFHEIKRASHLLVGITYLTMSHGEAWHFARLGRLLERADKTSRIVDVQSFLAIRPDDAADRIAQERPWAALLKSASALEMYRKRHGVIVPASVVDFLLLERRFPRALRYCLTKAERSLHAITGNPVSSQRSKAEEALGILNSELEFADTREIMVNGLHEFLDAFQTKLNLAGDGIFETFFAFTTSATESHETHSEQ